MLTPSPGHMASGLTSVAIETTCLALEDLAFPSE
jgi:hypothetical protein